MIDRTSAAIQSTAPTAFLRTLLLVAGALSMAFSCSDRSTADAAHRKCNALIEFYCTGIVSCAVDGQLIDQGRSASQYDRCDESIRLNLDCAQAEDVSNGYETCMDRLADPPCDDINAGLVSGEGVEPPSACEAVILFDGAF